MRGPLRPAANEQRAGPDQINPPPTANAKDNSIHSHVAPVSSCSRCAIPGYTLRRLIATSPSLRAPSTIALFFVISQLSPARTRPGQERSRHLRRQVFPSAFVTSQRTFGTGGWAATPRTRGSSARAAPDTRCPSGAVPDRLHTDALVERHVVQLNEAVAALGSKASPTPAMYTMASSVGWLRWCRSLPSAGSSRAARTPTRAGTHRSCRRCRRTPRPDGSSALSVGGRHSPHASQRLWGCRTSAGRSLEVAEVPGGDALGWFGAPSCPVDDREGHLGVGTPDDADAGRVLVVGCPHARIHDTVRVLTPHLEAVGV